MAMYLFVPDIFPMVYYIKAAQKNQWCKITHYGNQKYTIIE